MQVPLTPKSLWKRRWIPHGDLRKKSCAEDLRTGVLRKHSITWLSAETREHLKNCYNCWRPLKQGKVKSLFTDFNSGAGDSLCWLNMLSRLSFSDIWLQTCQDTWQNGGDTTDWEELQTAGGFWHLLVQTRLLDVRSLFWSWAHAICHSRRVRQQWKLTKHKLELSSSW